MFKTVILEDGSYSSELVVVQSAKEIKEAE